MPGGQSSSEPQEWLNTLPQIITVGQGEPLKPGYMSAVIAAAPTQQSLPPLQAPPIQQLAPQPNAVLAFWQRRSDFRKALGAELKKERLAQKLSLRKLGQQVGFAASTLSYMERGWTQNLNLYADVADHLGFELKIVKKTP